MNKRQLLKHAASVIALQSTSLFAQPAGPIKLIVPFPPGAANDTLARLIADAMAKRTGKTWIVDNKAGAGSQIGTDFVAKSQADGMNLLLGAADGLSVLPAVKTSLPYSPSSDFAYLARMATSPFAIATNATNANIGAKTLSELAAYAKANPTALKVGNTGIGALNHMGAALMASVLGIKISNIPYRGMTPAVTDLVAGHIDALLVSPATISPHLSTHKINVLAVCDNARSRYLPSVPSTAELGHPSLQVLGWWGIVAPAGLPNPARQLLQKELVALASDPAFQESLIDKGFTPASLDGPQFRDFAVADLERWTKVAKASGISVND